jgi:putative SOS response-associated peptidase YedK
VPAPVYYEWRDDPGEGAIRSGARRRRSGCFRWHLGRLAFSERRRIAHLSTITTDANRQLAAIQERMLVILEMTDWPLWLGEIEGDVPALLRPLPEGVLRM